MYDVNTWRARVGLFNLVRPPGKRIRSVYSGSDIPVTVTFIKNNTSYLFNTIYQHTKPKCTIHPVLLLIHISTLLYITITSNTLYYYFFKSKLHKRGFLRLSSMVLTFLLLLLLLCGDVHPNPGPNLNYSVCHLNVRSLKAEHRLAEVEDSLVHCQHFDFIAMSETHLGPSVSDDEVSISGYDLFRLDRNRNGGGVGFYCRSSLSAKRVPQFEEQGIELIWVEFQSGRNRNLLGCCYRPPGQSRVLIDNFLSKFQASLDQAIDSNPTSITILGDFNDRCALWDSMHSSSELGNKLLDLVNYNNFFQLINTPTRETNLLDLIITDSPVHYVDYGTLPPLSELDHCTVYARFEQHYSTSPSFYRTIWSYDQCNYEQLNITLNDKLQNDVVLDVNDSCKVLTDKILESMSEHIPHKRVKIRPRDKPWVTQIVRSNYRECHKAYTLKIRTNSPTDIENYKHKRRVAKQSFRTAR